MKIIRTTFIVFCVLVLIFAVVSALVDGGVLIARAGSTVTPESATDEQEIFQVECPYCHAPLNQVPANLTTNSVTHSDVGMKTVIARTGQVHCPVCNRDFTAHNDLWIADAVAKSIKMPSRKKLQMSMPPVPVNPMVVRTNMSVIIAPSGRTFESVPLSSLSMQELADTYTTNSAGAYLVRIVPIKQ